MHPDRPTIAAACGDGAGLLSGCHKRVAGSRGLTHIARVMFRLTKQEMYVVAFLIGAVLVGSAVRLWRAEHPSQSSTVAAKEP